MSECPRPEKLAERASRVLGTRSLVLPRCAQSPSFAALSPWLRHAVASPRQLAPLSLSFTVRSRTQRAGGGGLELERKARQGKARNGGVLRDHPLRMCAWLGKPDCSRQGSASRSATLASRPVRRQHKNTKTQQRKRWPVCTGNREHHMKQGRLRKLKRSAHASSAHCRRPCRQCNPRAASGRAQYVSFVAGLRPPAVSCTSVSS